VRLGWHLNVEGERSAEHYICTYRHTHGGKAARTHTFKANEIVSVTDNPNPDLAQPEDDPLVAAAPRHARRMF
jgi:hypothetical protein